MTTYAELLDQYREELRNFQFVRKKEIILKLAEQLELEGADKETISTTLTADLKAYDVSDRYIREVLGEDYKKETKKREDLRNKTPQILLVPVDGGSIDPDPNNPEPDPKALKLPLNREDEALLEVLRLENGKLKEQLHDQKVQINALIKSVNAAASTTKKPNTAVTDSLEYKALEVQNYELTQRVNDLEQLVRKHMKENPEQTFQSAAAVAVAATTQTYAELTEVELPQKELLTFFLDSKNAKQVMYLQIKGNQVITWESDYVRQKREVKA